MSFVGKWFGFGKDPAYDDGVRAYEKHHFSDALDHFLNSSDSAADLAVRERAKSYAAGCLGKIAREQLDQRNFEKAVSCLEEATELRPGFADLWQTLAVAHRIQGDLDLSEAAAKRALAINPQYGMARVTLGTVLYKRGDLSGGFSEIEQAVRGDSRLDTPDLQAGNKHHEAGEHDKALECYCRIKPSGRDLNDYMAAGDESAKRGDWQGAKDMYGEAVAIAPGYADLRCRLGQTFMELNDLANAGLEFQHAIAANPNYAEAYALLGILNRRQGDEENALTAFRRALDIDPMHPIASQEVLYRKP